MVLSMPPVKPGVVLKFDHFPTVQQCFIFRNWEMIPAKKLAEVLETTEQNVLAMAEDMGLPAQKVNPKWMIAGYITIIKNNWQLIGYDQMCQLLGWNEERLAYTIKEDDFLDVKLGYFKPDTPKLTYRELTAEEKAQTALLRASVKAGLQKFAPQTVDAFDFNPMFARNLGGKASAISGPDRFDTRIVYSYCALYGDVFTGDFEQSFPEKLLEAYQAVGVNGIWIQAVLYTLIEFPFAPELSDGWQARAKGLRALTERLDKYGIKLYLYINEPRAMPEDFFETRQNLKGAVRADGQVSLCTSTPEVQKYLYEGAAQLVRSAPKLGGFITITASENMTNCYSHFESHKTNCPRCKDRSKAEILAEVNSLLYRGAASVNPDFKLLAWTWAWSKDDTTEGISIMDQNVGLMAVSESRCPKTIGGVDIQVADYSISVVGPGEYAKQTWTQALKDGHRAYAKCQFNNTWECCTVPFIPAFETIYKHITNLIASGVGGLMLDWTLGGYPSPTFSMLKSFFVDNGHVPTLDEAYASVFPEEALTVVKAACHLFSEAFNEYPFHLDEVYNGPQNIGCGNLLFTKPTGFKSTMTCFAYDDLESWRAVYPEEVYENQFRLLTEIWNQGLEELKKLPEALVAETPVLQELCDAAEACYLNFRAVYLQTRFVRIRDCKEAGDIAAVIDEEQANTVRTANVAAHNSTIGYESANHYFFSRNMLLEKYVNCDYVRRTMVK